MLAKILPILFLFVSAGSLADPATSPVGLWQSFTDTGKPTGHIRITEQNGLLQGVIERGLPADPEDKRCTACKGERKDQPMQGMKIIWDVRQEDSEFAGGEILDPFNGNIYRVKLTLEEGGKVLKVRGFVGLSVFGRTQKWLREE